MKKPHQSAKRKPGKPAELGNVDLRTLRAWYATQYGILQDKAFAQIVGNAMADTGFRGRLLAHPEEVFKLFDVKLPRDFEIKVVENTPHMMYLVLPPQREATRREDRDLKDDDLKSATYAAWGGPQLFSLIGELDDFNFGDIVKFGGNGRDKPSDTRIGADFVDHGRDAGPRADGTDHGRDWINISRDKDRGDKKKAGD